MEVYMKNAEEAEAMVQFEDDSRGFMPATSFAVPPGKYRISVPGAKLSIHWQQSLQDKGDGRKLTRNVPL